MDGVTINDVSRLQTQLPQYQFTEVVDRIRFYNFDSEW